MVHSLEQIDWCPVPLVPPMSDSGWEKESPTGKASNAAKYLTPVRWLLQSEELMQVRVTPNVPVVLGGLIGLVVAMDNSCRHCYGAFRSMLKIMGYSEPLIRRLEKSSGHQRIDKKREHRAGICAQDFAFGAAPVRRRSSGTHSGRLFCHRNR